MDDISYSYTGVIKFFFILSALVAQLDAGLTGVGSTWVGNILSWRLDHEMGVVGWCEGAVYLTSPGRPTDIGLQLGKACYPCSG